MKLQVVRFRLAHAIMFGLTCLPIAVQGQVPAPARLPVPGPDGTLNWRDANDAVGQFRRGHADVLRWEQQNMPTSVEPTPPPAALVLGSAADAVRLAWRLNYELSGTLASLGASNTERIATGRWDELDPHLQRNIHGVGAVLKSAAEARKAWLNAVAARQALIHHRSAIAAHEAASELGRRMVQVGNWSTLQQARVELMTVSVRMAVQRAEYAAMRAEAELARVLRLTDTPGSFRLLEALPDLPKAPLDAAEVQRRLAALSPLLPRAESQRLRRSAPVAFEAYRASFALALGHRDGLLKLRELVADETVLRYNGMLKSVWDVLGETAARSQASIEAIEAQRDFWIAETDLHLVLQGEMPDSFVALGGPNGSAPATAPH